MALAYAFERENTKACAGDQDFFAIWNDASPDNPILKRAAAETRNCGRLPMSSVFSRPDGQRPRVTFVAETSSGQLHSFCHPPGRASFPPTPALSAFCGDVRLDRLARWLRR